MLALALTLTLTHSSAGVRRQVYLDEPTTGTPLPAHKTRTRPTTTLSTTKQPATSASTATTTNN